jgi:1-deoxy-D-xylulose-5-phosphate reductoisomerase
VGALGFSGPDVETFRCLALAYAAGRIGGTMPAALNAANEVAVGAFLLGQCGFLDIERVVSAVMEAHDAEPLASVDQVEAVDKWARRRAKELL